MSEIETKRSKRERVTDDEEEEQESECDLLKAEVDRLKALLEGQKRYIHTLNKQKKEIRMRYSHRHADVTVRDLQNRIDYLVEANNNLRQTLYEVVRHNTELEKTVERVSKLS
jgi:prefoldin subunit 5